MSSPDTPRRMSEESLYYFARYVLGYDKLVRRVHESVCEILQSTKKRRVNFTMPRNFFKSTLASVAYPLWRAANDPSVTIQITMNTLENAKLKLGEIKGHVERNTRFQALYPEVIPNFSKVPWGQENATLNRDVTDSTPTFSATGIGTGVISRHFDEIILDDILTARKDDMTGEDIMPSRRDIDKAIAYFRTTISLLKDPAKGRIFNIGTRWANKDLINHVLTSSDEFRGNNFEVRAVYGNSSNWYENEAVMPELYPIKLLKEIESQVGSTIFHLWYLNEPIDPSEVLLRPSDLNYYSPSLMPQNWMARLRKYTAVDLAYSDRKGTCNSAIATIGVDEDNIRYLIGLIYGKMEPMELINLLFDVYAMYKPRAIGIETTAAQIMMAKMLPQFMRRRGIALPIKEIPRNSQKSKVERIMLVLQPFVEQNMFKMPRSEMSDPLELEMADFRMEERRCGHTDALDAVADAIQLSHAAVPINSPAERRAYTTDDIDKATAQCYDLDAALLSLLDEAKHSNGPFDRQSVAGQTFVYAGT